MSVWHILDYVVLASQKGPACRMAGDWGRPWLRFKPRQLPHHRHFFFWDAIFGPSSLPWHSSVSALPALLHTPFSHVFTQPCSCFYVLSSGTVRPPPLTFPRSTQGSSGRGDFSTLPSRVPQTAILLVRRLQQPELW